MIFLQPLLLLGLAAAAVPALLHLLERRDPPELDFPPLRYLTEAERRSARRMRLRHLLLLLLRTAVIVVIVLAAARPLVPARAGGAHEATAFVIVLDNSPSSAAVVDGRPLFDRLRVTASASLTGSTGADRAWLLLADGVVRAGTREALRAIIDSVTPGVRRLDLAAAVERAGRVVLAEPLAAREVHVFSDLQRTALGDRPADVPAGVRVLALEPAGAPVMNRGIGTASVIDGALRLSVVGTRSAPPAPVTVRLGSYGEVGRALVAPGAEAALPLPSPRPGWWVGEVELDPDELRVDNRRTFVWRVAPPARVAVAPEAGPFVVAALTVLREGGRVAEGSDVTLGEQPGPAATVVFPPTDGALVGPANRALQAHGVNWRFGALAPPGVLAGPGLPALDGVPVARRHRLERARPDSGTVLWEVNGEPWLVLDGDVVLVGSRLDTAWTALPATPQFVPFVDALVNRLARGVAPVREAEGPVGVTFDVRGVDTVGATVLGPDPREADLTPAASGAIRRQLGAELLHDASFARERFSGTRRADVTGVLLALALVLAAVELAVATRTR
ncbi:MAG TPA: VWA domain-containing protein [Gemmatimonadales bacterium]